MRLALLSDIHGNPIALDAVLADAQTQGGVDGIWVLGDLAALGHDPVGVLERLGRLPQVRYTRGNTDRYLVSGERPPPTLQQAAANPGLLPRLLEVAATFAWTLGAVQATGWLSFLADLPLEQRLTLPDGTRLLGVHASPGADEGPGVNPSLSSEALAELVAKCEADLVVTGHTHFAMETHVQTPSGAIHLVNLGSVSNPVLPDLTAKYAILDATPTGHTIQRRQVTYDLQTVLEAIERSHQPGGAFISEFFQGRRRPPWEMSQ